MSQSRNVMSKIIRARIKMPHKGVPARRIRRAGVHVSSGVLDPRASVPEPAVLLDVPAVLLDVKDHGRHDT